MHGVAAPPAPLAPAALPPAPAVVPPAPLDPDGVPAPPDVAPAALEPAAPALAPPVAPAPEEPPAADAPPTPWAGAAPPLPLPVSPQAASAWTTPTTNIMQALVNGVPVLSAGKTEGKNDINARLAWRGLGIDLRTERPTAKQLEEGVTRVLGDTKLHENVKRIQAELASYRPFEIIEATLAEDGIRARSGDSVREGEC